MKIRPFPIPVVKITAIKAVIFYFWFDNRIYFTPVRMRPTYAPLNARHRIPGTTDNIEIKKDEKKPPKITSPFSLMRFRLSFSFSHFIACPIFARVCSSRLAHADLLRAECERRYFAKSSLFIFANSHVHGQGKTESITLRSVRSL